MYCSIRGGETKQKSRMVDGMKDECLFVILLNIRNVENIDATAWNV